MKRILRAACAAAVAMPLLGLEGHALDEFESLSVPEILRQARATAVAAPVAATPSVLPAVSDFALSPGETGHPGIGSYAIGYHFGRISKFRAEGLISTSGEGEMLLGNEGVYFAEQQYCGEDPCMRLVNPWAFSCAKEKISAVLSYTDEYAVIKYHQALVLSPKRATHYEILAISAPKDDAPLRSCRARHPNKESLAHGTRAGRLVNLSLNEAFDESVEATMQIGDSGSRFHYMSIHAGDRAFVACALSWLKSGRKVSVTYGTSGVTDPYRPARNYNIISLEPAPSGAAR